MLRFLGVYRTLELHCRPSEMLGIQDSYIAYCFDEACAYVISRLNDKETPIVTTKPNKSYNSPSAVYKKYQQENSYD